MSNRSLKSTAPPPPNDVEQLLQAAQDEMLLQLSIDAHMSHVAPDYLESDLDRRFQALKSKPSARQWQSRQSSAPKQQQQQQNRRQEAIVDDVDKELRSVLGDDLSARFAALKASSSSTAINDVRVGTNAANSRAGDGIEGRQDDEEDEVEKVIRWAMDAARLDPSPPSDDEDDQNKKESDDDDDGEDEDDRRNKNPIKK